MPNYPQAAYPFRNPVLSFETRAHILKAMRRLRSADDGFEMQLSCPMRFFLVFSMENSRVLWLPSKKKRGARIGAAPFP